MKFKDWSKQNTVQVRIRRDLRDYIKVVAKKRGKSMYYIVNEALFEKYLKYSKDIDSNEKS